MPAVLQTCDLTEVRVQRTRNPRKHSQTAVLHAEKTGIHNMNAINSRRMNEGSEYVYVNPAFVGSTNSVAHQSRIVEPPTSVIREQYWACSKWSHGQKILAVAVGVLMGAVIGLALTLGLLSFNNENIGGIFRTGSVPD